MDTGGGAAGAAAGLDPTALAFLVGALGLVVLMAVRSGVFRQALDVVQRLRPPAAADTHTRTLRPPPKHTRTRARPTCEGERCHQSAQAGRGRRDAGGACRAP